MTIRPVGFIGVLLIAAVLAPSTVQAQASGPAPDTIYLTGTIISETAAGAVYFRTTPVAPAKAASDKAYQATSMMGTTYQNRFTYVPSVDIELSGPLKTTVWVSCDYAVPFTHGASGVASSSTFSILRGTTTITGTTASRYDAAAVCTGPTSIRELTYELNLDGLKFKAGETINFNYNLWSINTGRAAVGNAHFLTNSTKHPAFISVPGLLGPPVVKKAATEIFNLTGPLENLDAVADATVDAGLSISNAGTDAADYTLNASAPTGFIVTFDPANGTLKPGATANATATIQVPVDASPGLYTVQITVAGPLGGNATITLTLDVQAAQLGTQDPNPQTGNGSAAASPEGSDTPGPSLVLTGLASLALAYVVRRRRQE